MSFDENLNGRSLYNAIHFVLHLSFPVDLPHFTNENTPLFLILFLMRYKHEYIISALNLLLKQTHTHKYVINEDRNRLQVKSVA